MIAMVSYSWLAFCLHIVSMSSQKQIPGQVKKAKDFGEEKPAKDNRRNWEQAESSFKRRLELLLKRRIKRVKTEGWGVLWDLVGYASDSWYWLRS